MSHNFTTVEAEISAINAGAAMLERQIKEITDLPLEDESIPFQISPISRTHFVRLPSDLVQEGYSLETFDIRSKPKGIRTIVTLEADSKKKGIYTIVVPFFSDEEEIKKDLEKLLLPF